MQKRTDNPMHREKRRFYVDDAPCAPRLAPASTPEQSSEDIALFCASEVGQTAVLNDALAIGHVPSIAAALGLIARVRGMSGLAAETGIKRQQLYRAFSEDGNPTLDTLTRVVTALGYRLSAQRVSA